MKPKKGTSRQTDIEVSSLRRTFEYEKASLEFNQRRDRVTLFEKYYKCLNCKEYKEIKKMKKKRFSNLLIGTIPSSKDKNRNSSD